ncbi:kinase-like protein [Trametes elegans]|nr:kinase-like protein [Trametes elegans]
MSDRSDIPTSRFPTLASVKAAIQRGTQIFQRWGVIVLVVDDVVIKYGARVFKSEALSMQLVRQKTTVPVPQMFGYFAELTHDGQDRSGYLVAEKITGVILADALPNLDGAACDKIARELRAHIASMRTLNEVGSWGVTGRNGVYHGGYFKYLHRPFTDSQYQYGNPCVASSMADVFEYFARATDDEPGQRLAEVSELTMRIDMQRPPVFTHGDLLAENIMIDVASASIVSIIDWERAGWYPYFWDNAVALIHNSVYQDSPKLRDGWNRIRMAAMENAEDKDAVLAYMKLHFLAFMRGQDEYPHPPCDCCF